MASDASKFYFRLVLMGANGTGKTSILNRFLHKKFEQKYKPTVEDLFSQAFDLGKIEIKVDFLDTSGSMQFPAMRQLSISTGNAFLIVYSVDDPSSFEALKLSISEIREIRQDFQEIPIVFAGNKCDIPKAEQKVSKETVSNYVYYELPRLRTKVIECSCKENINIESIFKAYLSLAKVSLASAIPESHLHKKRGSHVPTMPDDSGSNGTNLTPISLANDKAAPIGARKSCDGSIITSKLRNMSLGATSASPPRQPIFSIEGDTSWPVGSTTTFEQLQQQEQKSSSSSADGVFITDALRQSNNNKLAVNYAKPRSRSLIWRPSRKKSHSSSSSETAASDCRIS